VRAIVFAAGRKGPNYVTGLTGEEIANVLCSAVGHWGSGAEYLMQTVDQLERLGIRDANLWGLQRLVARQLIDLQAPARRSTHLHTMWDCVEGCAKSSTTCRRGQTTSAPSNGLCRLPRI
jgi:ChaC-like protein